MIINNNSIKFLIILLFLIKYVGRLINYLFFINYDKLRVPGVDKIVILNAFIKPRTLKIWLVS